MKKLLFRLLALLLMVLPAAQAGAVTPQEVLQKCVAKLKGNKAMQCSFSVKSPQGDTKGSLLVSGSKFKMTLPYGTTWYNGTEMWTANNSSKEITLVKPTDAELKETNPLSYIDSYQTGYRLFFSQRKEAGRYLVLLNPKTANSQIKAVEIAVDTKTYLPVRVMVKDRSNQITTVNISGLKFVKASTADFTCPVQSMKGYELVDLR